MKKALILLILLILSGSSYAYQKKFKHKDPLIDREVEKIYFDMSGIYPAIQLKNAVNVMDYGAKADGSTDDTQAIQRAVDTCRPVYFPWTSNYYLISSTIQVNCNDQAFFGDGYLSKIVQTGSTSTISDVFINIGHTRNSFSFLHVVPSTSTNSSYYGYGFNIINSSHNVVDNCYITGFLRGGVMLSSSSYNKVTNNVIRDDYATYYTTSNMHGSGVRSLKGGSYNIIDGNIIANVGEGISFATDSSSAVVVGNVISNNVISSSTIYGIIFYKTNFPEDTLMRNVVTGNLIDTVYGSAPDLTDGNYYYGTGIYIQGEEYSTITGNSIYNTNFTTSSVTDQLAPAGIGVTNTKAISISGNLIQDTNGWPGILVRDPNLYGAATGYAVITGNHIFNAKKGISCEDRGQVQITGNTMDQISGYGISFGSPQNLIRWSEVSIIGNNIRDSSGGIDVSYSSNAVISSNQIYNHSTYGISVGTSSLSLINGNVIISTSSTGQASGILLDNSLSSATVSGNIVAHNLYGIIANTNIIHRLENNRLHNNGINIQQNADIGYLGQSVSSSVTSAAVYPASTQFGDLAQVYLPIGTWDISGVTDSNAAGATVTSIGILISPNSGNTATGTSTGINRFNQLPPTATSNVSASIPSYVVSLTAGATYYLKYTSTYSGGPPVARGSIWAVKIQ